MGPERGCRVQKSVYREHHDVPGQQLLELTRIATSEGSNVLKLRRRLLMLQRKGSGKIILLS